MNFPLPRSLPLSGDPASPLDRTLVTAFLENIPDLVYFKDRDSRFIAVSRSKAERHGLEPGEMVGKSDSDFFSPEHAQRARADEERIIATGEQIIGKMERVTWPDGRQTWSESSKQALRDEDGSIIGTCGLSKDVTADQQMRGELETAQRNLVEASRLAGMAEVATGVLHNVGNVLTSVNVSANLIAAGLHRSKADSLTRLAELLQAHASDLDAFVTQDPKGQRIPDFLTSFAAHALEERDQLLREITSLQENIDHIKEIVTMQQAYATMVGVVEPLEPAALMEDALRMNAGALLRHEVTCVRDFQPAPRVLAEKAKVLQILVNLIRNAKYATDETGRPDKRITLRVAAAGGEHVQLVVEDNGIGIPPENLGRLFTHGFTTRSTGHGFGLHSSLTVARELKGNLTAQSEGTGRGARFTLELPVAPPAG